MRFMHQEQKDANHHSGVAGPSLPDFRAPLQSGIDELTTTEAEVETYVRSDVF
jgi:hypothetical protein